MQSNKQIDIRGNQQRLEGVAYGITVLILEEWECNRQCSQLGRDGLLKEFARLGVRNFHPLLDTEFGQLWMDFFVTKEGRHDFGKAYAWLLSRIQPIILRSTWGAKFMLRKNTPVEFLTSFTTSVDVPCEGRPELEATITSYL